MLSVPGNAKIYLFRKPVNLRKGFVGLTIEIEQAFSQELTSGAYFLFLNKRRDRMKVLYWDGDGLVIWYKRLEKGTFSKEHLKRKCLDRKEFFMLLEGIIPKRFQKRYKIE